LWLGLVVIGFLGYLVDSVGLPSIARYGLSQIVGEVEGCEVRFGTVTTSFVKQSLEVADVRLFCSASQEEEIAVAKIELGAGGLWPGSPRVIIRSIDLTGARLLWGEKYSGLESLLNVFSADEGDKNEASTTAPILRSLRVRGEPGIDAAKFFFLGSEYRLYNPYFTLFRSGMDLYTLRLVSDRAVVVRGGSSAELGALDLSAKLIDGEFRFVRGRLGEEGRSDFLEFEPGTKAKNLAVKSSLSGSLLELIGVPPAVTGKIERANITGSIDSDIPLNGADGRFDISLNKSLPAIKGKFSRMGTAFDVELEADSAEIFGGQIGTTTAKIKGENDGRISADFSSRLMDYPLSGSLRVSPEGALRGSIVSPVIDPALLSGPLKALSFFGGDTKAEFEISGTVENPAVEGKVFESSGNEMTVTYKGDSGLRLRGRLINGSVLADLSQKSQSEYFLRIDLQSTKVEQLLEGTTRLGYKLPQVTGVVSGSYEVTGGLAQLPFGRGSLKLTELVVNNGPDRIDLAEEFCLILSPSAATIKHASFKTRRGNLALSGAIYSSGALDLKTTGQFSLSSLIEEFPNIEQLDGDLDLAVNASGSLSAPILKGQVKLSEGRFIFPFGGSVVGFSGTKGTFHLDGDRLSSTDLVADFAGARVTGTGSVEGIFDNDKLGGKIELNFADVLSEPSPGLTVSLKGHLGVSKPPGDEILLFGDLIMGRSGYSSTISLASLLRSFQELLLPPKFVGAVGSKSQSELGAKLDLSLTTADTFVIDTSVLKAELGGAVNIRGRISEPLVTGMVSGKSGEFLLGRKRFALYASEADFTGEKGINPKIRLVAETEVRGRDGELVPAQLMISGRMDSPRVRILSSAGLSETELMSQLASSGSVNLFGNSEETGTEAKLFGMVGVSTPLDVGARISELIGLKDVQVGSALTVNGELVPEVTAIRPLKDPLALHLRSQFSREQESAVNLLYSLSPDTSLLAGIRTNTPSRQAAVGSESAEAGFQRRRYFGGFGLFGWLDFTSKPMPYEGRVEKSTDDNTETVKAIHLTAEGAPPELHKRMLEELSQFYGAARTENTVRSAKLSLLKIARDEGYLQASVEEQAKSAPQVGEIDLVVFLRSKLYISFKGNTILPDDVLLEPLKIDSRIVPISIGSLNSLQLEIKALYQRYGHYYVTTTLEVEPSTDKDLRVVIHINEGPNVSVSNVQCVGNINIENDKLIEQLVVKPRGSLLLRPWEPGRITDTMLERDRQTISEMYRNRGFFDVKVESNVQPVGDSVVDLRVVYTIEEGERSKIESVRIDFEGDENVRERVFMLLKEITPGSNFDAELIEQTKAKANIMIRNLFAFYSSDIHYSYDRSSGILIWHVASGRSIRVGAIEIVGNSSIDTQLLQRELTFYPGDQLTEKKIEKSIQNLYESGLVSSVKIDPKDGIWNDDKEDLVIGIKEREGGIASSSVTVNSEDGLHLNADLTQRNLFATGNTIRLRADTYTKGVDSLVDAGNLGVSLGIPHVDGSRGRLTIDTFADFSILLIEPYSYNKIGTRLNYDLPIGSKSRLRLTLHEYTERLFDVPDDIEISENDSGRNFFGGFGTEIDVDERNDRLTPTKGNRFLASANLFSQVFGSTVNFAQLLIKDGFYLPATNRSFWYLGAAARAAQPYSDTDTVPLSHRYFLGGRDTLRGFSRNVVGPRGDLGDTAGGDTAFNASAEYHYRLTESFETLLFVDVGQTYLREKGSFEGQNDNFGDPRYSPGIGFRFITPVGPLGVEYGINPDQQDGERSGRFYFGLGGTF
jgi:outer membrane protein insertion porin family